jgi:hypothetical protein
MYEGTHVEYLLIPPILTKLEPGRQILVKISIKFHENAAGGSLVHDELYFQYNKK